MNKAANNNNPLTLCDQTYVIGSGKGGVGKSTVSVNLAVALAAQGFQVGLVDADLYGPSIPIMTGLRNLSPRLHEDSTGREKVTPFHKFGVKIVSMGFFLEEARSILWRGPMLHGALQKILTDVEWGDLDYLLIDLPPGTGDIQISLSSLIKINGALVVTTPQEVAAVDVIKALNAFDFLNIPLVGIIENMSFEGEDGAGKTLATNFDLPLLAQIPFDREISLSGDIGLPPAYQSRSEQARASFLHLAKRFQEHIHRNTHAEL